MKKWSIWSWGDGRAINGDRPGQLWPAETPEAAALIVSAHNQEREHLSKVIELLRKDCEAWRVRVQEAERKIAAAHDACVDRAEALEKERDAARAERQEMQAFRDQWMQKAKTAQAELAARSESIKADVVARHTQAIKLRDEARKWENAAHQLGRELLDAKAEVAATHALGVEEGRKDGENKAVELVLSTVNERDRALAEANALKGELKRLREAASVLPASVEALKWTTHTAHDLVVSTRGCTLFAAGSAPARDYAIECHNASIDQAVEFARKEAAPVDDGRNWIIRVAGDYPPEVSETRAKAEAFDAALAMFKDSDDDHAWWFVDAMDEALAEAKRKGAGT